MTQTPPSDAAQRFLRLWPITSAIAGLTLGEAHRYLTPEQMENRQTALANAWRHAQRIAEDKGADFVALAPIMVALAGLSSSTMHFFTEEQLENRATAILRAYPMAKALLESAAT